MKKVRFGASQLKNPTPTSWANAINVFTVIAGAIIGWIGTVNFIPHATETQSILGLLLTIANGLKPFLGVETQKKFIPTDEVGSMDAK